jgi:two-component system sensor histidine kinase HydH
MPVSPWIVIGSAMILGIVLIVMAWFNLNREKAYITRILTEKGAALIKSFEAGARTGMRGDLGSQLKLQTLLRETAAQSDIVVLTVTDDSGTILAHSNEEQIGHTFLDLDRLGDLNPDKNIQSSILSVPQLPRAFLVYSTFTPLRTGAHRMGMGPGHMPDWQSRHGGMGMHHGMGGHFFGSQDFLQNKHYIFVGLEIAPWEEARAIDVRNTVIIAGVLLLLGVAGVVSLLWANRVQVSTQLLQDQQAFSAEVMAHLPVGLIVLDRRKNITFVNQAFLDMVGNGGRFLGRDPQDVLPQDLVLLIQDFETEHIILEREVECQLQHTLVPLSVSGAKISSQDDVLIGWVLILRDLREVKALEETIRHHEKMAAIGNLAAGVAHEIRNPLSSIKGYATYFKSKFHPGSSEQEAARILIQEVDRLNRTVTELLEFARPSQLDRQTVQLDDLVRRSLQFIEQDAEHKGVRIDFKHNTDGQTICADPDRLNQALLNLYVNAIQAMDSGGQLNVSLGPHSSQEAIIRVSDSGPGIPSEEQGKIFDPYFSTKKSGTGLGLAIVHKIIEAHGGRIKVHSLAGSGSTFIIVLPKEELCPSKP